MGGYYCGSSSDDFLGGNVDINLEDYLLLSSMGEEVESPIGGSSGGMSGSYALVVVVLVAAARSSDSI